MYTLSDADAKLRCRLWEPGRTCKHVGFLGRQPVCTKGYDYAFLSLIRPPNAPSDRCSGPPDFLPLPEDLSDAP